MNTIKGFYASIASPAKIQGPYLEALVKISQITLRQANTLKSSLGWQEW